MRRLINIELTPNCFANCSMCPRTRVLDRGFIETTTLHKVIEKVKGLPTWEFSIAGRGEPTLHPNFDELLRILKNHNLHVAVVTTAAFMPSKNINALKKYVDKVRISVSSIQKETFNKIHRGLDFDTTWNNIEILSKAIGDKIVIHLVGGEVIYNDLKKTVEHLKKLGLNEMYIFPLWNRGGMISAQQEKKENRLRVLKKLGIDFSEKEYLLKEVLPNIIDIEKAKILNSKYCPIGDSSILISFKGDILGCFQDFSSDSIMGNVFNDNLEDIIDKRLSYLGRMPICQGCNSTTVGITENIS